MTYLKSIVLALAATAITILVMPLLSMFEPPAAAPDMLTDIQVISWQPPQPQTALPTLKHLTPPPKPAPKLTAKTSPKRLGPPPPIPQHPLPRLVLKPPVDLDLKLPPIPLNANFKISESSVAQEVKNNSSSHEKSSPSQGRIAGSGIPAPAGELPSPDAPLREKLLVKPTFPRNTVPLNGSIDLAFTVEADGTVSQVNIIRCDAHLPYKYRRQAIRAARQSLYFPATRNGKPIPVRASRRVDFIVP